MPRYIDADALISSIENELWDWQALDDITATSVLRQTITDIRNMPTADVRENVHAHWIHERLVSTSGGSYPIIRCSSCHWPYPMSETRFCPNCGARMEGSDAEVH